jgi:MoaA/NifB/PqqE/SkfB family radical SAM enzyme
MSFLPWFPLFGPRFQWLQVEVTTHCQAACSYCPHTVYRDRWQSRHLDMAVFQRLLPELSRVNLAYLQGWGEPFLHPEFFTMVSLARQAGCQVGTTTNGMLLDREGLTRLVDLEVAVVAFSLAGIDANDRVRRGTRLATVLQQIELLKEIKARRGAALPRVHVAYLLLASGLEDLPLLPQTFRNLGVSQVVVSTLDFVASPALAPESLKLAPPEGYHDLLARLADLAARGRRLGVPIAHHLPPSGSRGRSCPEHVTRALTLAADGTVAPCVFLNLDLHDASYVTRDGVQAYQRLGFGSLTRHSLLELWRLPAYRAFRRRHRWARWPAPCRTCLHLA